VWTGKSSAHYSAAYTAKVRVSVRAGSITIVREGSGTGEGKAFTPGQAHELALKGAETDATKRALATFGNPFGLALYDRELGGVRKVRNRGTEEPTQWELRAPTGVRGPVFEDPQKFAMALLTSMSEATDVDSLFAVWESNVLSVRQLHRHSPLGPEGRRLAQSLVTHLKNCAVAIANGNENHSDSNTDTSVSQGDEQSSAI